MQGSYASHWVATLGDHDSFLGQVFEQGEALTAKLGDAEVLHT
jgi:hypothetical protein